MEHHNIGRLTRKSRVLIAWFSGTGCTKLVAEILAAELTLVAANVESAKIPDCREPAGFDFLFICYPVHASNPPKPVLDWVRNLLRTSVSAAVILSVSGGGDVWPNPAARVSARIAPCVWDVSMSVR